MNKTKPVLENDTLKTQFYEDVIRGLSSASKYLESKYFYDARGDELFQKIMHSPEYYLTNCELEILSEQTDLLIEAFASHIKSFDLVELGAGDALKSTYLLKSLLQKGMDFTYFPIDISANVISMLTEQLPKKLPGLSLTGLNGEYFDMLKKANELSERNKIVLLLGSNIGNMYPAQAEKFSKKLRENLLPGDLLLVGFDLKKNPQVILDAYNDKQGYTRDFNLNLLNRINNELGADFIINQFQHYSTYDPETGSCKSYLVSTKDQSVQIGSAKLQIDFKEHECIHMEISQKYTIEQICELAKTAAFTPLNHFFDSKKWFVDAIWLAV